MSNQGQQQQNQQQQQQPQPPPPPPPPPQQQQQQAAGAANQQLTQQNRSDIGQATNAPAGSLASYETVGSDQGIGDDVGKYKNLKKVVNFGQEKRKSYL